MSPLIILTVFVCAIVLVSVSIQCCFGACCDNNNIHLDHLLENNQQDYHTHN